MRLIAEELASNHMSRHIKKEKERKKVVHQEAPLHHPVEIPEIVEGLQEEKVQAGMNSLRTEKV